MSQVFSLQRPGDGDNVYGSVVSNDSATIVALDAVNEGDVNRDGDEFRQLRGFLASLEGQREYQAYQQFLRENAEVERP